VIAIFVGSKLTMIEIFQKYRIINLFAALIVIALTYLLYYFVARPYQLTLGATTDEIQHPMPGDELVSAPHFRATRSITIQGTPEEIWPWLLQMGHNRAGYYAYDILENIGSEQGLRSAEEIIPDFQNFQQGDEVPISAVVSLVFYAIEPNQHMVWTGKDKNEAFAWVLYPLDDDQTRLVSRIQWRYHLTDPGSVVMAIFVDTGDHIAVRKVLQGIKGRVEGQIEPAWVGDVELAVFVIAFGIFVAGLIVLVVRPLTWARWLAAFGAGIVWLVVWYAPIWF
jgi:hypothetical protein